LTTGQLTLDWDPTVLKFLGTESYGLSGMDRDSFGTSKVTEGQLYFGWDDPTLTGVPVADGKPLFVASFQVIGARGTGSRVDISGDPTPIEFSVNRRVIATSVFEGMVAVRGISPGTVGAIRHKDGGFELWYEALPGKFWILQASDDLIHWTNITQPTPGPQSSLSTFVLTPPEDRHRYYRAVPVD
jgi:hypothetical protein